MTSNIYMFFFWLEKTWGPKIYSFLPDSLYRDSKPSFQCRISTFCTQVTPDFCQCFCCSTAKVKFQVAMLSFTWTSPFSIYATLLIPYGSNWYFLFGLFNGQGTNCWNAFGKLLGSYSDLSLQIYLGERLWLAKPKF